jgi:predicted protein tyrosine phosphatase
MPILVRWLRGHRPARRAPNWSRIAPRLFIGPALDRAGFVELTQQGVTHVVDLRAEASDDPDPAESLGLHRLRIPVVDRYPPTDEQFEQLADWLETSRPNPVMYIHCQRGLERSPTVAIGLLVRAGYELHEARAAVLGAHPHARPTPAQEDWLTQLHAASGQPGAAAGLVDNRGYTHRPNSNRKRGET